MTGTCPACGGLKRSGEAYCRNCIQNEEENYRKVKNYLRANPNSNAMQVANATGVSISRITRYIRQGSLSMNDAEGPRSPRSR